MAGEFINKYLPPVLKADVEFRYRLEYKDNYDFDDNREDEDAYNLYRTRVSLKYTPVKPVSFFIQGQDARVSNLSTSSKALMRNLWDIRQLYGKWEDEVYIEALGLNKAMVQAGRVEFAYGAERLIGGFNWSNVAQTFDGGRFGLHFAPLHLQLDVFAGDKVGFRSPQESRANDLFGASTKDRVYAYYATAKPMRDTLVENYFIHRQTWKNISFGPNGSGEVDNYTFGGRLKNKLPLNFDYEIEMAGQWGNFNDKEVRAMMLVGILGHTFDCPWQPRMAFEFDYASGDSDPTDGTMTTFDNLYPTNHPHYGYMDLIALQNMNDYRFTLSVKPHKKWKLQADVHMLYLQTAKDAFYSAGRTVTRTPPAGKTGVSRHVGNEIDLSVDFKLNNYVSFHSGYSHLFHGAYLEDTGANHDPDFVYFQTTVAF